MTSPTTPPQGDAREIGPEQKRLADRLFNDPTRKTVNFSFTPGPKATPEGVCREINKAMDAIEAGDYEVVDDIDGDLPAAQSPTPSPTDEGRRLDDADLRTILAEQYRNAGSTLPFEKHEEFEAKWIALCYAAMREVERRALSRLPSEEATEEECAYTVEVVSPDGFEPQYYSRFVIPGAQVIGVLRAKGLRITRTPTVEEGTKP